jgi:drug/metabolite transporter (DMT)-like permease
VASALLFGMMALVTKIVAARLPGPEIALVRLALGLLGCLVATRWVVMQPRNMRGLILRGGYGGAAVLLYFIAIGHLPVGIATLLNYTAPVFTAIYAALFLREPLSRATLAALALTSAGVVLVIKGTGPSGSLGFGPWHLVGLGSAMLSGAAVATIRDVRKTDGPWEIFAAFCIGGAVISAPPALLNWVPPRLSEWLLMVVVGSLSLVAQLLMTYAFRYVRAAVGGVIVQLTPVASLALGWIVLDERIAGVALVGAALALLGVSLGTYLARKPA